MMTKYTGMHLVIENKLHVKMLERQLTPNLANITSMMKDELELAVHDTMPDCDGEYMMFHKLCCIPLSDSIVRGLG